LVAFILLLLYLIFKSGFKGLFAFVCCAFNYVHRSSYELVQNGFQRHRPCDNPVNSLMVVVLFRVLQFFQSLPRLYGSSPLLYFRFRSLFQNIFTSFFVTANLCLQQGYLGYIILSTYCPGICLWCLFRLYSLNYGCTKYFLWVFPSGYSTLIYNTMM
jgi:hypothetical protein